MLYVTRSLLLTWIILLLAASGPSSVMADVLRLKDGEELGDADTFLSQENKNDIVILLSSGETRTVATKDVASMELDGPREIGLKNGDVLHVTNVTLQGEGLHFESDLLREIVVPFDAVTAISFPAGKAIAKLPVPEEPESPPLVETEAAKPAKKWKGNIQLGYASTSGRQDTQNANLSAEAVRESESTRWTLGGAARYGETDGEKDVDAQEVSGKCDVFLSDRVYVYGDLGALRDSINLTELRLSPGLGIGRKFITGDRFSLEGEAGTTYIWERQEALTGETVTETDWYGRIAGRIRWKLGETAEFSEELEILPGLSSSDEFRYRSVSQITATLTSSLSLAAGFTVDYDDNPPEGVPKTSTNASTGFIYNF